MSLQQIITQIQGCSSNDDFKALRSLLRQATTDAIFKQQASSLLGSLNTLNTRRHTLGYLFILDAFIRHHSLDQQQQQQQFLDITSNFLRTCNPQHISADPSRFVSISRTFKTQLIDIRLPKHGIIPLQSAIQAVRTQLKTITPLHADFFQLCLLSKCYSAAIPFLDEDPTSIDPGTSSITATDVLLYLYYGGLIEVGLKRYQRALDLFLIAITTPTQVSNAITLSALKKYILISLLLNGKVEALPRYTAVSVMKMLKGECTHYQELACIIMGMSPLASAESIHEYVAEKQDVWVTDGNTGLVHLIVQNSSALKVKTLTETYLTLSLDGIAQQAGFSSPLAAEMAILKMVGDGTVHACIDDQKGMVTFQDIHDTYASEQTAAKIDNSIQKCMEMSEVIAYAERALSKENMCKLEMNEKLGGAGGGGSQGPIQLGGGSLVLNPAPQQHMPAVLQNRLGGSGTSGSGALAEFDDGDSDDFGDVGM